MLEKAFLKSSAVVVCLGALACTVPYAAAGITIARQPWSGEACLSTNPSTPTVLLWAKPGAGLLAIKVDGVSEARGRNGIHEDWGGSFVHLVFPGQRAR